MDASPIVTKRDSVQMSKEKSGKNDSKAKYNLRTKSILNRIEVERRKNEPRHPKPKQRPAPLSKYRRRTANFRERCRMQEMNDAFKRLESAVPDVFSADEQPSSSLAVSGKGTKINTLKLAVNYISALTQMLTQSDKESHLFVRNNENAQGANCGQVAKPKCHTLPASTSHKEANRHRDLSDKFVTSQPKVNQLEFGHKPKVDTFLNESAKVIRSQESNCLSSVFHFEDHLSSSHFSDSSAHCDRSIHNATGNATHCQMNNFDLQNMTYSLGNEGQNLLDDFSALIDDLHENSFCLVDELVE